ncbi:hypoxanthine-guanine phosphoribosyltransferase [Simiduia litorea]|uniref:hypoxanthine-guanine phosphoribosyltransferase n=1 Tax=Simiduia litorea TaxID=1435348 RepID=UPI0036F329B5
MSVDVVPVKAKLLVDESALQSAFERLANELNSRFMGEAEAVVLLTVMNGGMVFAGQLIPKLRFPLICDYLHATRYDSANKTGALDWKARPSVELAGRKVIVVDDILDQGVTCAAINAFCTGAGATQVVFVVMVAKPEACRKVAFEADLIGLSIPDQFVFGMGMDYSGLYRNLPAIYFMPEES